MFAHDRSEIDIRAVLPAQMCIESGSRLMAGLRGFVGFEGPLDDIGDRTPLATGELVSEVAGHGRCERKVAVLT